LNGRILIGSRGSRLAEIQAGLVLNRLKQIYSDVEFDLLRIKTQGDEHDKVSINKINTRGVFVKEIQEAYAVLSDPEKKRKYDQLGSAWEAGTDFTPPHGWEGIRYGSSRHVDLEDLFGGAGGFSDFFQSFFGGFGGSRGATSQQKPDYSLRGADLEATVELSLEEAHRGAKPTFQVNAAEQKKKLTVNIAPGARNGSILRLAGKGQKGFGNGPRGDLYLRIRVKPHPVFDVSGKDDVEMTLQVTPWEAALGAKIAVPTLDGSADVSIPPGTGGGRRLRLRGRGLRRKDGSRGDQFVKVDIVVPPRLTDGEKKLFEELSRISAFQPRQSHTQRRAGR